ncbi:MAG: hypothetical protein ABR564_00745, partial [Candidatus Dormibacteria bacterium]
MALAEEAEPALTGADQLTWLARLHRCQNDLREGLRWFQERGACDLALRMAGALALFWRLRGCYIEGRDTLAATLEASPAEPESGRGKALWGLGFMRLMLGQLDAANGPLQQSLEWARKRDHLPGQARSLLLLGNHALYSDGALALTLLEESARLADDCADTWCQAHALALAGRVYIDRADVTMARGVLE